MKWLIYCIVRLTMGLPLATFRTKAEVALRLKNFMSGTAAHESIPSEWLSNIPTFFRDSTPDDRTHFLGALRELLVVNQMVDVKELLKTLKDSAELTTCSPLATILHFINLHPCCLSRASES